MTYALVNSDLWGVDGDTVVISKGRVVRIGWEHSLRDYLVGIRRVDIKGSTVLPPLHDAHSHPHVAGKYWVSLRGISSVNEFLNKIKSFKERVKPPYVIGRGWDQEALKEGRPPSIDELDEALGEVPAVLIRFCGHVALINSALLRVLRSRGIYDKLVKYMEIIDGRPTGIVFEKGVELALNALPKPSETELVNGLRRLLINYKSLGILYINFMDVDPYYLKALRRAVGLVSGIHIAAYVSEGYVRDLGRLLSNELVKAVGGSELRIAGVKTFIDGSLGGRTAYLRERYSDADTRGVLLKNRRDLRALLNTMISEFKGNAAARLAAHAIGDAALDEFIAFAKGLGDRAMSLLRVEHASLSPKDVIESLAELSVPVAVQPHFLVSDWWAERRLGKLRARWLYPFKSMIRNGVKICGSSDYPVEPFDPYLGMSAAASRGNLQYLSHGEGLSLNESLNMYLWDPFFGPTRIKKGVRADLIVLNKCLRELNPYDLSIVKPVAIIVSGRFAEFDS